MKTNQIVGLILLIAAISCYYFKIFESDLFNFISGIVGAIGFGLLAGWTRKS